MIRRSALWAVAAGLVALASSCGGSSNAVVSSRLIAFSSDRALPPRSEAEDFDTRRLDLYLMEIDGSNVERLTRNSLTDVFPAVSRDGRRVAFTRDIHGDRNRESAWTPFNQSLQRRLFKGSVNGLDATYSQSPEGD